MWNIKPPMTYALETKYKSYIESLVPTDPISLFNLKRGSPEEEYPNLKYNYTCMANILTLKLYTRQFNRATQSGVIFDDVIRPGLEEPGELGGPMTVGCAAGDAQSYILFCDFFDQVIEAYQNHKMISLQKSDFNYDNLKGGEDFDQGYALSCEVSAMRAVDDFSFPIHCSRGERRELLKQAKKAFDQFTDTLPGKLYSVAELSNNPEDKIANIVAPSISQFRNGLARDWPDSRAVWISNDRTLLVWVNIYDHLRLVTTRDDANIAKAFQCICVNLLRLEALYKKMRHPFIWKQQLGWVVSSPADVGTGLRASIRVKLQQLPRHKHLKDILRRLRLRMENTVTHGKCNLQSYGQIKYDIPRTRTVSGESASIILDSLEKEILNLNGISPDCIGVYNISNAQTIGMDEVGFTQLVVDGVKLLIRMEKRLEIKENIADLIPLQK